VYALARRIDDVGDGSAAPEEKLAGLQTIRKEIDPIDPQTDDPVLAAVADAAGRYGLTMSCFGEIIDGCEMDVNGTSYETIDDLVGYCRRVAGSWGGSPWPCSARGNLSRQCPSRTRSESPCSSRTSSVT